MSRTFLSGKYIPYLNGVLFSLYPLLVLYAHNVDDIRFSQAILPVAVSLLVGAIVFTVALLAMKRSGAAGLFTVAFLLVFWFYTPLKSVLSVIQVPLADWLLIPVFLVLLVLLGKWLKKAHHPETIQKIHTVLLLPVSLLVAVNIVLILPAEVRKKQAASAVRPQHDMPEAALVDDYPDVYLIVLDEYASFVSIEEEWGYDASGFEQYLDGAGFFVARESKTRFANTLRALPSILNLDYVSPDLSAAECMRLYDTNLFMEYLDHLGYGIVFIDGWGSFEYSFGIEGITFYCMYNMQVEDEVVIDPFHYLALSQSVLSPFASLVTDNTPNLYYRVNNYFFNYIEAFPEQVNASQQPKLLYAHLMTPHLPFVFDRDGNFMENPTNHWEYASLGSDSLKALYLEQYIYVTRRIRDITRRILDESEKEPVIILFSDHGVREESAGVANTEHHHRVLNAVYFPGRDYTALYDSIAPVNTMRAVMNQFFGHTYEMLDDF